MKAAVRATLAALIGVSLSLSSVQANAQPKPASQRQRARALIYAAREKRAAGAVREAVEDASRAHAMMRVPTTALELAKAQVAAGLILEARASLNDAIASKATGPEPKAFVAARAEATELLERIKERVPTLTIAVPDGATVSVDGAKVSASAHGVPLEMNPGTHEIVFVADGVETRRSVVLAEGAREVVRAPEPAPEPRSSASAGPAQAAPFASSISASAPPAPARSTNPLVYVGGGVLVAGVATGAVFGALTLDARSSMEARCGGGCGPDVQDDIELGKTYGTVSTVAFAAAGAGAVLLVYGLLFPSESHSAPTVGRARGASFSF